MAKDKIGMYGETPQVKIGKYTISRQDPDGADKTLWISNGDEGFEIEEDIIEDHIEDIFDLYM